MGKKLKSFTVGVILVDLCVSAQIRAESFAEAVEIATKMEASDFVDIGSGSWESGGDVRVSWVAENE